eukprot:178231-Hanusia_phi.AAC.2
MLIAALLGHRNGHQERPHENVRREREIRRNSALKEQEGFEGGARLQRSPVSMAEERRRLEGRQAHVRRNGDVECMSTSAVNE